MPASDDDITTPPRCTIFESAVVLVVESISSINKSTAVARPSSVAEKIIEKLKSNDSPPMSAKERAKMIAQKLRKVLYFTSAPKLSIERPDAFVKYVLTANISHIKTIYIIE